MVKDQTSKSPCNPYANKFAREINCILTLFRLGKIIYFHLEYANHIQSFIILILTLKLKLPYPVGYAYV